jgi:hypothetical protein
MSGNFFTGDYDGTIAIVPNARLKISAKIFTKKSGPSEKSKSSKNKILCPISLTYFFIQGNRFIAESGWENFLGNYFVTLFDYFGLFIGLGQITYLFGNVLELLMYLATLL